MIGVGCLFLFLFVIGIMGSKDCVGIWCWICCWMIDGMWFGLDIGVIIAVFGLIGVGVELIKFFKVDIDDCDILEDGVAVRLLSFLWRSGFGEGRVFMDKLWVIFLVCIFWVRGIIEIFFAGSFCGVCRILVDVLKVIWVLFFFCLVFIGLILKLFVFVIFWYSCFILGVLYMCVWEVGGNLGVIGEICLDEEFFDFDVFEF